MRLAGSHAERLAEPNGAATAERTKLLNLRVFAFSSAFLVMWRGMWRGVCIVASAKRWSAPASRDLASSRVGPRKSGVHTYSRANSAASIGSVPEPNMTQLGFPLYSKLAIVYQPMWCALRGQISRKYLLMMDRHGRTGSSSSVWWSMISLLNEALGEDRRQARLDWNTCSYPTWPLHNSRFTLGFVLSACLLSSPRGVCCSEHENSPHIRGEHHWGLHS